MKWILGLVAAVGVSASASAATCVALEYQEMRDMDATSLTREYCATRRALLENLDDGIADLGRRSKWHPNSGADHDQCKGQIERIMRVLAQKGIEESALPTLCK